MDTTQLALLALLAGVVIGGSVSAVIVLGPVISLSRVSTTPRDHKPLHTDPERQALVRGPAYVYTPGEGGAK